MKHSVLFVDDDKNLLDGLRRSLHSKAGEWEIKYTQSAHEALALCEKESFHCVVSDYKMPEMDGLEFLAKIKEKHSSIKLILLTGQSEEETYARAKESVDLYLSKPCSAADIIQAVEKLLQGGSQ
jgi:DNA-binding NarL/FixJ family response regulator